MSIVLYTNANGGITYQMGTGAFFNLRLFVVSCISSSFKDHFERSAEIRNEKSKEYDIYKTKTMILKDEYGVSENILHFLYDSVRKGRIFPETCDELIALIGGKRSNQTFGYEAFSEFGLNSDKFLDLLQICSKERRMLMWKTKR